MIGGRKSFRREISLPSCGPRWLKIRRSAPSSARAHIMMILSSFPRSCLSENPQFPTNGHHGSETSSSPIVSSKGLRGRGTPLGASRSGLSILRHLTTCISGPCLWNARPRPLGRLSSGQLPAFHLSPINPVVCRGSYLLNSGEALLGEGFPLRCFQQFALPNVATQLCRLPDNWPTSGSSSPVLSY